MPGGRSDRPVGGAAGPTSTMRSLGGTRVIETGRVGERRPFEVAPPVRDRKGGAMKRAIFLATVAALSFGVVAPTASAQPTIFRAVLSGRRRGARSADSLARGVATFRVNEDETELAYRLVVANIEDVSLRTSTSRGLADVSGPVVVYAAHRGLRRTVATDGVVAAGTVTAADTGNACGWAARRRGHRARVGRHLRRVHMKTGSRPEPAPASFPRRRDPGPDLLSDRVGATG